MTQSVHVPWVPPLPICSHLSLLFPQCPAPAVLAKGQSSPTAAQDPWNQVGAESMEPGLGWLCGNST